MLIKKVFLTVVLLFCGIALFAQTRNQNLKPMSEAEIRSYELLMGTEALNPYVPRLRREVIVAQLEELHKVFVQSNVPETLDLYLKHGQNQIPTKSRIMIYADKLKRLIADPELLEVSGYQLDWFRSVGNTMVTLGDYHAYFMHAVNRRDARKYHEIYMKYHASVTQLNDLMQKPLRMKQADHRRIKNNNTAARKRKYDLLEARYQYTLQLQKKSNQNRRQGAAR